MSFDKLLDDLINETIKEYSKPIQVLVEISDDTYEYIVNAAENIKPGTMNSYFGGQQRVVIPLVGSDNPEIQKFYDEVVIPLAAKGYQVDLKDGTAKQYIKTQKGTRERVSRLGKIINKQMPEETKNWWNKVQAKFLGNPDVLENKYSIVISQSPVDVARMSDHREIQSCHSPGSDYFQCALADARRAGAIAYLIDSDDVPYIESHLNDTEVFADRDRDLEGVTPLARVRLRRFDYIDDDGFIDAFLVPETRVYGRNVPGFVNAVIDWAREEQDNHPFFNGKIDLSKVYHRGGSYSDSDFAVMFNNLLGMENIELNDDLEMYNRQDGYKIKSSRDEDYVDFVSSEGIERQMQAAEEEMNDIAYEYFSHEDVNFDYDLEWDQWGDHPIIESYKITLEIDLPVEAIVESEIVKNNPNIEYDPEDEPESRQDQINHRSIWSEIESVAEEAYKESPVYNEYLDEPEVDAQAEFIRFGQKPKLIYRIRLVWEGGGKLVPLFQEEVASEIYNVTQDLDELKIDIVEKLIDADMYAPTDYQKVRKSIKYDAEEMKSRLDGKTLGHFHLDLTRDHILAYSNESFDNYPTPGVRKVGKFPAWGKADESPPLSHILGFDEHNYRGMSTRIAYDPKIIDGMLLNPMWTNKVVSALKSDLQEAAKAAEDQLSLSFAASGGDEEKDQEWKSHENALEILDDIYIYLSSDDIYRGGESPYTGNAPSRRGTGGLYFKFKETDNSYTIRGLLAFLKYFDKNYDVVQKAMQEVWDEFVQAYNENAPIVQEESLQFLRRLIQNTINEEMNIEAHPQKEKILAALNDPNYLVHFSDLNKVGINPKTSFNTPAGIYGWHWTDDILDKAAKNKIFGSKRKYAHIMKIKDGAQVLWLGDDKKSGKLPSLELVGDVAAKAYPALNKPASEFFPENEGTDNKSVKDYILSIPYQEMAQTSYRNYGGDSESEKLYDFIMVLARVLADFHFKSASKRTIVSNKILRLLGFDAVIDTLGTGIIHKNEPQQGFFTSKGGLERVATVDNTVYSLPTTSVMSILTNPKSPSEQIEQALNAVLTTDKDLKKSGKGRATLQMDDRLDILDYATGKNTNLSSDQLMTIQKFVENLTDDNLFALVGNAILHNILAHPNVPDEIYQKAVEEELDSGKSNSLRVNALMRNPVKPSPELLRAVATGGLTDSTSAQRLAISNPNVPVDAIIKYIRKYPSYTRGRGSSWRLAMAAMRNPSIPRSELLDLLYDEDGNVVLNTDIMRDIVTSPNLPVEAMRDILETISDKDRMYSNNIPIPDILESFIMSRHVPDEMALEILKNYKQYTNSFRWENDAIDLIRRALRRHYTEGSPKKVSNELLQFIKKTFEEIKDKSEYDATQSQKEDIVKLLTAQGAYKKKNENKDFASILRGMISEQIKNISEEEEEDSKHVAKVVFRDGRKVLLIKRSDYTPKFAGSWDLPGGHIHIGEDKLDGLEREVNEETGLSVENPEELYSEKDETFYIADLPNSPVKLSDEHTEYKLVDIDDIAAHDNLSPKYKDVILTAMEDEE